MFTTLWPKLACLSLALTLAACSGTPLTPPSVTSAAPGAGTARLQIAWPARQALAIPETTTDIHIVAKDDDGKTLAEVSVVRGTTQVQLPKAGEPRLPAGDVTFSAEALGASNEVLARASAHVTIDETGPTTVQLTFNPVSRRSGGSSTVAAAPTITSITPNSGFAGSSITLAGTNFRAGATVTIGGVAATVTAVTDTSITVTVPLLAAGAHNVVVTNTDATTVTSVGGYTVTAPPTITSLSPNNGPATGGTSVTITGTNLTGATSVSFGGTSATSFTVNSATQLTAVAPAHAAGAVDVAVTAPGGTVTSTGGFTYNVVVPAPTISSVSPNNGPETGGTSVTITGTNFAGATAVSFGGTPATSFTVDSATQLTAVAPAHAAGAVDVVVTTAGGTGTATGGFTYTAAAAGPFITSFSPNTYNNLMPTVVIEGTGFTGVTSVKFGTTEATILPGATDTQIEVTPPGGLTGMFNIEVTTPLGTATSTSQFMYPGGGGCDPFLDPMCTP